MKMAKFRECALLSLAGVVVIGVVIIAAFYDPSASANPLTFSRPMTITPIPISSVTAYAGQMAPGGVSETPVVRIPVSSRGYWGTFTFKSIGDASGESGISVFYRSSMQTDVKSRDYQRSGNSPWSAVADPGEWALREKIPILLNVNSRTGNTLYAYPFWVPPGAQEIRFEFQAGAIGVTPVGLVDISGVPAETPQAIPLTDVPYLLPSATGGASKFTIPAGARTMVVELAGGCVTYELSGTTPSPNNSPKLCTGDRLTLYGESQMRGFRCVPATGYTGMTVYGRAFSR